jgi:L-threonylcarbamoyladenylate synthase
MVIPDGQEARARAARVVGAGGVVGFRTDTFYGLGVDPFNRDALRALNELKGREGKPVLVLVAERADARRLWEKAPPLFDALAARHWPGALTIVCAARPGVPEELTAGTGTVGVRLPADEDVRALVRACGGALTATSANPAGEPPARSAADVRRYFQDRIDLVIDGGETKAERPSTVLDIHSDPPVLVREGVVTRAEIEATLKISRR